MYIASRHPGGWISKTQHKCNTIKQNGDLHTHIAIHYQVFRWHYWVIYSTL